MMALAAAERVEARVPAFKQVGGYAQFMDAQQAVRAKPACFLLDKGEAANGTIRTGRISHVITHRFAAVVVVGKASARPGGKLDEAATLRDACRDALVGWLPEGAIRAVLYRGYQLVQIDAGLVSYLMEFDVQSRHQTEGIVP